MSIRHAAPDGADEFRAPPDPPRMRVIRSPKRAKTVSARMVEGVLEVRVPAWISQDEEDALVSRVAARFEEKWRCGHVPLAPRAKELAEMFNLPEPSSIRWSSRQNFRWGSCSSHSGNIRISSRLAQAPPWVLDHVIVHELAHLVVAGHGHQFQELVNRNPNAERAEGYLLAMNDLAPALHPSDAIAS